MRIVLNFTVEDGRPTYSMSYKGKEVVRPSHLGLELAKDKHASMGMDERDLMSGFSLDKEETSTFDETWQPVWGETRDIRNHYNEYVATNLYGVRPAIFATTIMSMWQRCRSSGARHLLRQMAIFVCSPACIVVRY